MIACHRIGYSAHDFYLKLARYPVHLYFLKNSYQPLFLRFFAPLRGYKLNWPQKGSKFAKIDFSDPLQVTRHPPLPCPAGVA
jgi:hypothetical protein